VPPDGVEAKRAGCAFSLRPNRRSEVYRLGGIREERDVSLLHLADGLDATPNIWYDTGGSRAGSQVVTMRARRGRKGSRFGRMMDEMAAILWLAALSLVILSGARAVTSVLKHQRDERYPQSAVVEVKRGDCLWSIAKRLSRPGEDPRRMVHILSVANRISTGQVLYPGDRLVVPYVETRAPSDTGAVLARR
jgi:hypothetical protein